MESLEITSVGVPARSIGEIDLQSVISDVHDNWRERLTSHVPFSMTY